MPADRLERYLEKLLTDAFPDEGELRLGKTLARALERVEHCFSRVALRGYRDGGGALFNHLHGDQFASFLYFVSNQAWRDGNEPLAHKAGMLNRARNALLIMPDTELPDVFVIPHTVGTVMGKATYADYLVVCQNVTVANDLTTRLTFGPGVVLFPGAFVVGTGTIGEASVVAANATLQYRDVPANTVVSGRSPDLEMHPRRRDFLARFFVPPYPGWKEENRA